MTHAFVYVTDEKGFGLTQRSAVSVALSQRKPCDIYIFCYDFAPICSSGFLSAFKLHGHRIFLKNASDPEAARHQTCGHVTTPTLLKLAVVEQVIYNHERTVYLDSDILVFDDLEVNNIDFGNNVIAAVADLDLSASGVLRDIDWAMLSDDPEGHINYFNAGVIIFDCTKWEGVNFRRDYLNALERHNVHCDYKLNCTSIDQCALNHVFEDRWLHLPAAYNMQASAKFTPAWQTALVRHYCGTRKFLPISPFRNDARDVAYLNIIQSSIGEPTLGSPVLHQGMFNANRVRSFRRDIPIRRLLKIIKASSHRQAVVEAVPSGSHPAIPVAWLPSRRYKVFRGK